MTSDSTSFAEDFIRDSTEEFPTEYDWSPSGESEYGTFPKERISIAQALKEEQERQAEEENIYEEESELPTFKEIKFPEEFRIRSETEPESFEGAKCCICLDGYVPSTNLSGCINPVCSDCVESLNRMECPKCKLPINPVEGYVNALILSKQMEIQEDSDLTEELLEREESPDENPEELYQGFEDPTGINWQSGFM